MPIFVGEKARGPYKCYYGDELNFREISLYQLLELEVAERGQTEESAAILKKIVDLMGTILESSPNGQKHLKDYINMSSVQNVEYREGDGYGY
jgi:hypothetical protein